MNPRMPERADRARHCRRPEMNGPADGFLSRGCSFGRRQAKEHRVCSGTL